MSASSHPIGRGPACKILKFHFGCFEHQTSKTPMLPSGSLTVCHRKSPFLIGKRSINEPFPMAIFNNQRVNNSKTTTELVWLVLYGAIMFNHGRNNHHWMRLLHSLPRPRQGRRRRAAQGRRHGRGHGSGGADLCAQRRYGEGGPADSMQDGARKIAFSCLKSGLTMRCNYS